MSIAEGKRGLKSEVDKSSKVPRAGNESSTSRRDLTCSWKKRGKAGKWLRLAEKSGWQVVVKKGGRLE